MTAFSENGTCPRKPPVTYNKRPRLADRMRAASTLSDDGDNEARGAQAFDRIHQQSRITRNYGRLARRATNVINGPRSKGLTLNALEQDDIAEAMTRSLGEAISSPLASETGEQHDSDLSKAKLMPMLNKNPSPKPPGKSRSYKNLGSGSTSTAASPHDALHSVLYDMDMSAKVLEKCQKEGVKATGQELANRIREWQGTIAKVVYASQAAELRRIKDLQAQLDFDRDIEATHAKKINGLDRFWADIMKKKEQGWQRKMEELKGMYKVRLTADNTAAASVTMEREQVGGETAYAERVVDHSGGEIEALKSEDATIIGKMKATHAGELNFLKRKFERLAEENAHFRQARMKMNGEQSERQRGHSEPILGLRNATSPGKRKLEEAFSSEGADWSPKRSTFGSTV
ncbi:hypothetical protein TW65_08891 [Stemphylium lycopersici]|nr:hypothetical protein TW65_08891 [Stemphylium lycopersici]